MDQQVVRSHSPVKRQWLYMLGLVLCGVWLANTHLAGISLVGMNFLALLLVTVGFWVFEIMPVGSTSLLFLIGLLVFKIAPPPVAFSGFTQPIFWFIVASLALGVAVDQSGLGKRLAYAVFSRLGVDSPSRLLLAFLAIGVVLTFLIPTVFGRLAILLPLGRAMAESVGVRKGSRYGKFLMWAVFYGAQGPLLVLMNGFEPALVAVGNLARAGYHVYWGEYLVMWLVPGLLLSTVLFYVTAMLLFRPAKEEILRLDLSVIQETYRQLGPITKREVKVGIIFLLVILGWIFGPFIKVPPTDTAIFGLILLFVPGISAMHAGELRSINILNIVFFAAALSIGTVIGYLKLTSVFTTYLEHWVPSHHLDLATAFVLGFFVQVLHLPLSTVTATLASVSPVFTQYAKLSHVSPVVMTWIVVASATAYLFPYQAETVVMAYGEGYWSMWDVVKQGLFVSVVTLLLTPIFAVTWWPWTASLFFH